MGSTKNNVFDRVVNDIIGKGTWNIKIMQDQLLCCNLKCSMFINRARVLQEVINGPLDGVLAVLVLINGDHGLTDSRGRIISQTGMRPIEEKTNQPKMMSSIGEKENAQAATDNAGQNKGSEWVLWTKEMSSMLPIRDSEDLLLGKFDKPLPCFGCGIGWFSFVLGLVCPLIWYYATILFFANYYHKDPRERAGLAASAIAALIFTIAVLITLAVMIL
ncbi:60S ribosomal protein L18a-like protein [Senna tora]|uniref:60S ribosomal protein L18a-like protein n=1 Tax=Senna tora TaxID=362788 RepID=A0A834WEC3_9FABA|nr:60S ribosomal protein L18a-like protein [Senna tora]